jgi:amphi-Trp domain-containing protein
MKKGSKRERDVERTVTRAQFAAKLRRVADALEAGRPVMLQVKGERVRVPQNASFSIEHEREGGAEEIEFQVQWER